MMIKKAFLVFIAILIVFAFSKNDALSIGSVPSQCVVVEVGNPQTEPDLSKCQNATGDNQSYIQKLLEISRTQIGKPYSQPLRCGPDTWKDHPPPTGCSYFDCSSFAGWAWYWATDGNFKMYGQTCRDFGGCLARYDNYNYYKFDDSKYTKFYSDQLSQIQPGDLVYFGYHLVTNGQLVINHVAIYTGPLGNCGANDCIIHSSGPVAEVSLSKKKGSPVQGFLRPKIN